MSLGPILHRGNIADRQFTGDLSSLFARHRIAPGSAYAFANFESRFALSEAFRSQLFTLCTAISHMSESNLTGEQLMALIACALNSTEASDDRNRLPEWVRVEFEDGYDAWNARDLSKADEWQTRPQPTDFDPVPFAQPAEADVEQAGPGVVGTSGPILFQIPLDIAPRASAWRPQAVADVDLEHLSLDELTRLLEKMEHRIGRLKPLTRPSVCVAPEREETPSATVEQAARPVPRSIQIDDAAFLRRHAYLMPERRVVSIDRASQIAPSSPIVWEGLRTAAAPVVASADGSSPATEAAETATTTAGLPCWQAPRPPRDEAPASFDTPVGRSRASLRPAIGAFAASAMFVIAGGFAGIVLYPSAVAKYFNQPSMLGPSVPKSAEITQASANPGPLANAPTNRARRVANALSHRAPNRNRSNAETSKPTPVTDGVPPQPK